MISPSDVDLFFRTDSVDEAFEHITTSLREHFLVMPAEAQASGAGGETPT